jgi:hypothetical protein
MTKVKNFNRIKNVSAVLTQSPTELFCIESRDRSFALKLLLDRMRTEAAKTLISVLELNGKPSNRRNPDPGTANSVNHRIQVRLVFNTA